MRFLSSMSHRAMAAAVAGATMISAGALVAQSAAPSASVVVHDDRWQPWLGCWKPSGSATPTVSAGESVTATATMICVVPGKTATSVEILNFSGGNITERTTIEPAQPTAKKVEECSGSETATWSADGRRLIMSGTFTCGRGVSRKESGIMAIDADGEWVQTQTVSVGGNASTFVAHFRDTGIALEGVSDGAIVERPMLDLTGKRISPPRDGCKGTEAVTPSADGARISVVSDYTCAGGVRRIADAQFVRTADGQYARVNGPTVPFGTPSVRAAAGAPVSADDVLEVAKVVDPTTTEAWLTDRGQGFMLNGKELLRLAKGGMPPRIIDMMVAVSNPQTFVLQRNEGSGSIDAELAPSEDRRGDINRRSSSMCMPTRDACYGMMGLGWLYGADRYYGWGPYGYQYGYPFSRFGNGFGYPYYGGYWGPGYFNGNGPVVVVVPGGTASGQSRGRAVYGQGYTRGGSSGSSGSSGGSSYTGSGRSTSGGSSSGGSSSSGSSAGSSSSGSSGGGESSARTAKPRGGGL